MANLQPRYDDLRAKYNRLKEDPTEEMIQELRREVNELVKDAAGVSDMQQPVKKLLGEVIRLRPGRGNVTEQLTKAKVRINAGGNQQDLLDALDILSNVLKSDPGNSEAIDLLEKIVQDNSTLKDNVVDILLDIKGKNAGAEQLLLRLKATRPSEPEPARSGRGFSTESSEQKTETSGYTTAPPPAYADIELLQKELIDVYYKGDYTRALQLCAAILNKDPDNVTAREYQAKAEDSLRRGVVLDTRIPLEAKVAFNRGTSAMRASQYEDARGLFEKAMRSARDKGIERWQDAEDALLRIENLSLAEEIRKEGDQLMAKDKWDEALENYENALAIIEEPRTRKKYDLYSEVNRQYKKVGVQLSAMSGNLVEMAKNVMDLRTHLTQAREELPNSQQLQRLVATVEARAREIRDRLRDRGVRLLDQAANAATIDERVRLAQDAQHSLEAAHLLQPDEAEIDQAKMKAGQQFDRLSSVKKQLDEARQQLSRRDRAGLDKVRGVLEGLTEYAEDSTLRNLVSDLQHQILEESQSALEGNDLESARSWLAKAEGRPFNILGRSEDTSRLRKKLDALEKAAADLRTREEQKAAELHARQRIRNYFLAGGAGVGVIIILAIAFAVLRPVFFPPPTPTPTITLTPTITPTDTSTPTPTATFTPTPTPTGELCLGVIKADSARYKVREDPDETSTVISTVDKERRVRILDQTRDKKGQLWYKIDYGDRDVVQQGWIMAVYVIEATDCPALH